MHAAHWHTVVALELVSVMMEIEKLRGEVSILPA